MHQMSFAEFASAQKPSPLPVHVIEPLSLNYGAHVGILRLEFEWDFITSGSCLDATDRVPLGGHLSFDTDRCSIVRASSYSRGAL